MTVSLRRKAIAPSTFSDGLSVGVGDVACTPMRAIMKDKNSYSNATVFDGYRFAEASTQGGLVAKVTKVEAIFPHLGIWQACLVSFYFPCS